MEKSNLSVPDFWLLPSVKQQIQRQEGTDSVDPGLEPWVILSAIVTNCFHNDDSRRCRRHLGFFADLIRFFRINLEKQFGPLCWQRLEKIWEVNDKKITLLHFVKQIALADRGDAIWALVKLKTDGLTFRLPGGYPTTITPYDHGITWLVEFMREMESNLNRHPPIDDRRIQSDNKATDQTRAVVTIKPIGGRSLEVRFCGRCCQLENQEAIFLLLLKSQPAGISDTEIWGHLYPGEDYVTDAGGPPGALRGLKSRTDRRLLKALRLPPNGGHWIVRTPGLGYCLNRNAGCLVWAFTKEDLPRLREVLMSSRRLDGKKDE